MNNPYPGLRYFKEHEKDNFFGRDADQRILSDQILANRLTLLFAASGVGKSSLLRAAVIPRLRDPLEENLDVVYFRDWVKPPLNPFKQAILNQLKENGTLEANAIVASVEKSPLPKFLEFCSLFSSQPLVLILDQFEEFFRYQKNYTEEEFHEFIDQLTDVILHKETPVYIVLSMREDFALELNEFKPRLPMMLFENFYRLGKLPRKAAEDAIKIPAQRAGYQWEPALFDKLLKDLLSRDFDRSKGQLVADRVKTVEPPYLQIICSQLWERDKHDTNKTIRLATYQEAKGAKGLLDNYLKKEVLDKFSHGEKVLSSRAFDHLVSRQGTKMPHTAEELSKTLNVEVSELNNVLNKLAEKRVLRTQKREEEEWYELYHDMFSESIDDWNLDWKSRLRTRRGLIGLGSAGVFAGACFIAWDIHVNANYQHLRMDMIDQGAYVELWQGKQGSWDILNQQKFLKQTPHKVVEREPYMREETTPVTEPNQVISEMIAALPNNHRVKELVKAGHFKRALVVAERSISDRESRRSSEVIEGISSLKTDKANSFLWSLEESKKITKSKIKEAINGSKSLQRFRYLAHKDLLELRNLKSTVDVSKVKLLGKEKSLRYLIPLLSSKDSKLFVSAAAALLHKESSQSVDILISSSKSKDPNVRNMVTRHLRRINSIQAENTLISLLDDDDENVQYSAIFSLGRSGSAEGVNALVSSIESRDVDKGWYATRALGEIGTPQALDALVAALSNENSEIRDGAISSLGQIGNEKAVDALILALNDKDSNIGSSVVDTLRTVGTPKAVTALITALSNPRVSRFAVYALGEMGSDQAVDMLMSMLKDKDSRIRERAVSALGRIGNAQTVDMLRTMLTDDDSFVRRSTIYSLGEIGSDQAVIALLKRQENNDVFDRRLTASALGKTGSPQAVNALVTMLNDNDSIVRENSAISLGEIGSKKAIDALLALLSDEGTTARRNAISGLEKIGNIKALNEMLAMLHDEDQLIRGKLAVALGEIASEEAENVLIATLNSEYSVVTRNAAAALGTINSIQAVDSLVDTLKTQVYGSVISQVVNALGEIGSPQAIDALITTLGSEFGSYVIPGLEKVKKTATENSLIEVLNHYDEDENLTYLSALASLSIKHPKVTIKLGKVFKSFQYNSEAKEIAATGLLNNRATPAYSYIVSRLNEAPKGERLIALIEKLANVPTQQSKELMLERFDSSLPRRILLRWFEAFKKADVKDSIPFLEDIKKRTKIIPVRNAAEQTIMSMEENPKKIQATIKDNSLRIKLRRSAFDALVKLPREIQIESLTELLKNKVVNEFFESRIHLQLNKLRAKSAKGIWKSKLAEIRKKEDRLQIIRANIQSVLKVKSDNPPTPEDILENRHDDLELYRTAKQINAVPYASALARIDTVEGLKMLSDPLFEIRKGAWTGLSSIADAKFVRDMLAPLFWEVQDKPLFRHAVFRAIDNSLTTIQHNTNQDDLALLKVWYSELIKLDINENPVAERVDWTIAQIEASLKLHGQLQKEYEDYVVSQDK